MSPYHRTGLTRWQKLNTIWMLFLVAVFIGLSACANILAPQTVREAGLQAYGSIAVVRSSAADLYLRDQITKPQAAAILRKSDEAQTFVAAAMKTGDGSSLQKATAILLQVEAELKARQK